MFQGEEWAVIEEFPQYLISSHGRVKHKDRTNARKVGINARGFPVIIMHTSNSIQHLRQINQLVARAFLPPPERVSENSIIHLDGDLTNCHYMNLRWATRSEVIEWNRMRRSDQARYKTPPVRNNITGRVYKDAYECALAEGRFESDIVHLVEVEADNVWDKTAKYSYVPLDEYLRMRKS